MACSMSDLTSSIEALLFSSSLSDVTLVVDGTHRIPAHRWILALRSEYFRSLFLTGMVESEADEVKFDVVSLESGRELLRYLYTGRLREVADIKDRKLLVNLLKDAHFHALQPLVLQVADTLVVRLNMETVVSVYQTAKLFELEALSVTAFTFMMRFATKLMTDPTFLDLTQIQLEKVVNSNSFDAKEKDVLGGVMRWLSNYQSQHNKTAEEMQLVADDVLSTVRFQLMTVDDLLDVQSDLSEAQLGLLARHNRGRGTAAKEFRKNNHYCAYTKHDEYTSEHLTLGANCNWGVTTNASGRNVWVPTTEDKSLVLKLPDLMILSDIFLECSKTTSFYIETSLQKGDAEEELLWTRPCPLTEAQKGVVSNIKFPQRAVRKVRVFVTKGGVFTSSFRLKRYLKDDYCFHMFGAEPVAEL